MQDLRYQELTQWLRATLGSQDLQIKPLLGDASFRRYFRVFGEEKNYIAVDSPPQQEKTHSFIALAHAWLKLGLKVPELYGVNEANGFMLLTDFGNQLYLDVLNIHTADDLYKSAIMDLLVLQSCKEFNGYVLPKYDTPLYLDELNLFHHWYLTQYQQRDLTHKEKTSLERVFQQLTTRALAQPQVCVHRDYHSRNLMFLGEKSSPGIIDFQDAVWGPISYDLVSLLKDCYIDWPEEKIQSWIRFYLEKIHIIGSHTITESQFRIWFDIMGLQRHLKCLGIFARLHLRDKKSNYLQYIPRILQYVKTVCEKYSEYESLLLFL